MITKLSPAPSGEHGHGHLVPGHGILAVPGRDHLPSSPASEHGGNGEVAGFPPPTETVHLYGDVFGKIAMAAMISAAICLALSPLLSKWIHNEAVHNDRK